jgi:hypothetical protein
MAEGKRVRKETSKAKAASTDKGVLPKLEKTKGKAKKAKKEPLDDDLEVSDVSVQADPEGAQLAKVEVEYVKVPSQAFHVMSSLEL